MTRSGLELDVGAIRRAGRAAARLTVLPGVSEALAVGVVARWVFELPFVLALALGFILAAVSPAVVVVGMFDLHNRGYGVAGHPEHRVAAASMATSWRCWASRCASGWRAARGIFTKRR